MARALGLLLTSAIWLLLSGGCGGRAPATSYIILELDTSALQPGADTDQAMEAVEATVERRAEELGGEVLHIQRQDTNVLAIEFSVITAEEARDFVGVTALVAFYEPERDETGENLVCTSDTGETFTVAADVVELDRDHGRPANLTTSLEDPQWSCIPPGSAKPTGTLNWVPAEGIGSDGQEKALSSRFLRGEETEVVLDPAGRPFVQVRFNSEGAGLLEQITGRLLGLPLAFFLDDELISAPTVQGILSADCVITGLELDEADTLARLIRAGTLPLPVTVIAAGEGSLP